MPLPPSTTKAQNTRALLLAGLLPLILFTIVEEYYGTLWGLVAGMVFGVGEIIYEWVSRRKVETMTWVGNGMLLGLGSISLFTREGIWFKMQPAILETVMGCLLIGSAIIGKPFLLMMAQKQNLFERVPPPAVPQLKAAFKGLTARIGVFFLIHAAIATWAALYWSTRAWALLKGVGFTVSLLLYMGVEVLLLRKRMLMRPS